MHETCQQVAVKKWDGGTYNHADSVHQLVIHPYNAKQPLLQHLHDDIPHLMAKHCLAITEKYHDLRHETCQQVAVKVGWMAIQSC